MLFYPPLLPTVKKDLQISKTMTSSISLYHSLLSAADMSDDRSEETLNNKFKQNVKRSFQIYEIPGQRISRYSRRDIYTHQKLLPPLDYFIFTVQQ
jgi:hypothetical protein